MSVPGNQEKIVAEFKDFLADESQWGMSLSGTGAVYRLERQFAALVGHPFALAVANATAGLWAVFMAFDIHDAEVVTTPYTWGGSLSGLIQARNQPVFADIDAANLTLDPESVRRSITAKTKALFGVDIYGCPCDGAALRRIADEYGLPLIQDCAQSFGAYMGDKHTGWWADAAVFSCGYGKALFAGEGGVIVTPHEELYQGLVWLTQHPTRQKRDIDDLPLNEMALNLRINPLTAVWAEAVFQDGLAQAEARRRDGVRMLRRLARASLSATLPPDMRKFKPSFHVLTFEPYCAKQKVEQWLKVNDANYLVTDPPIVEPLYCHEMYHRLSDKYHWAQPHRCPMAEQKSAKLLRLIRKE